MIRLLTLATLLVLVPLPLGSLHWLAPQAQAEEGETGMAARPHFVVEAGVRVPAATSASVASRLLLPTAAAAAPPYPTAHGSQALPQLAGLAPTERLMLLGRLLLDGG